MAIVDESGELEELELSEVFPKEQLEYLEEFKKALIDDDSTFLLVGVTHKKTGKIQPCLLLQVDDENLVIVGIVAMPGDGIMDEYDFGTGEVSQEKKGEKRVEGVDFVYSSGDNCSSEGGEGEWSKATQPGLAKKILKRLGLIS